jgi:hypothetical protein
MRKAQDGKDRHDLPPLLTRFPEIHVVASNSESALE